MAGAKCGWIARRKRRLGGVLHGCDAVVNCVGILRPRGHETYQRVHHLGPAALAAACAARGLRLVHVSALGLDDSMRSHFLRSKRDGEAALRASDADWHIVRPSLLDGEGGFGARWIRRVARWPLHPLPPGASGRLAVLDVRDLGEAIANLALAPAPARREHDLGGLQVRTLAEHLAALRALHASTPAWLRYAIPDIATRTWRRTSATCCTPRRFRSATGNCCAATTARARTGCRFCSGARRASSAAIATAGGACCRAARRRTPA